MGARQQGIALLMVLLALAFIGVSLPLLMQSGRQEIESVRQQKLAFQARQLAVAAQVMAARALTDPRARRHELFWRAMRGEVMPYPMEGGEVRLQVRDLRSCFNVNALAGAEQIQALQQLAWLLRAPRDTDLSAAHLTQRLADWVDADTQALAEGAEAAHYLRLPEASLAADGLISDVSEINRLYPPNRQRYLAYPELCALPEAAGWRLNLNALGLEHLPLLDALYLGEVPNNWLARMISARPLNGYADAEALRDALPGVSEALFKRITAGLILNSDYYLLGIEVNLDGQSFRYSQLLRANGVSKWNSRVAAQQVTALGGSVLPLWRSGPGAAMRLH